MKELFEKQLNVTQPLTEEVLGKLKQKTYFNGEEKQIGDVIHSISPQILKELYQMGFNDGWNEMSNTEYSHDSEVKGFDKVIEELHKKYCV